MKIGLYLAPGRSSHTGITNYRNGILQALAEVDPNIEFLDARFSGWKQADFTRPSGISGPSFPNLRDKLQTFVSQLQQVPAARYAYRSLKNELIKGVLRSKGISLFHAFNFLPPSQPSAPTLPVVYDLSFIRYPHMHPKERLRALEKLSGFIERAPFVHTISEFSKREIVQHYNYPADRIFVAYPAANRIYGATPLNAAEIDLQIFDLKPKSFFLAVGTIEPRKNLKTLIAAYSQLTTMDRHRMPLVIVGGGGWGNAALPKSAEKLIQEGSLRFLGFVPDEILRSLYQTTALMLYPSIYEGFGMPVVEAMACGARVAHSVGTSMDEITDANSVRIDALDPDGWAACMRKALSADFIDHSINAANIKQAMRFDWRISACTVRDKYVSILSK